LGSGDEKHLTTIKNERQKRVRLLVFDGGWVVVMKNI
jgi:hypothetical protein